MNAWSVFSGVGGFDLGLSRAGINVTLTCEFEPWRRRVLELRFPQAVHHHDVTELHGTPGAADILCGGFPCQDLSVAGKRAGLAGSRSGLFFEFARIAEELDLADRDGWVFLENVPGLLSSNGGRDFGVVLQTLADLGFAVGYRVLDSRFFGVPQRRRRVFIVGHPRADYARTVLFESEGGAGSTEPGGEARPEVAVASISGLGSGGADDNDAQAGRLIVPALTIRAGNTQDDQQTGQLVVAAPLTSGTPKTSSRSGRLQEDDVNLVAYALRRDPGGIGQGHNTNFVAFHSTQDPISSSEHTPALSKGNKQGVGSIAVAFSENQRAEVIEHEYAHQLTTGGGKPGQGYPAVRVASAVRRLTPTECERLQGFPDGWTAVDGEPTYAQAKNGSWRCKEGTPDAPRYAAMGDAVTVNVIEWIARRIYAVQYEEAAA